MYSQIYEVAPLYSYKRPREKKTSFSDDIVTTGLAFLSEYSSMVDLHLVIIRSIIQHNYIP
jgi:hypothetical protein